MIIHIGILTAPHIEALPSVHDGVPTTILRDVRIGIGFHWDRHEEQEFEGSMAIRHNTDGSETAINTIDLEDYLTCVVSSEMRADSPLELLRAHAIIARSWALRNLGKHAELGYDLCADDCCQRYEGIRRRTERAIAAVRSTAGLVLTYDGQICDCRYSKCCGGRTEIPSTCWDDLPDLPYLTSVECPWCDAQADPRREAVLLSVLNDYDLETRDFHSWVARYDNPEVIDLRPLRRGPSGRIAQLEVVYRDRTLRVGRELAIRRFLSPTCLKSSAFSVERQSEGHFLLRGRGWGHGVGLCQIGAALWAADGATYKEILNHYYPGSTLKPLNF